MEDPRVDRAITLEDNSFKSDKTGIPTGAYVYIMYEGNYVTLDFVYDSGLSEAENTQKLKTEIYDGYLNPVKRLEKCSQI